MSQTHYRNLIPGQFQIGDIVMGRGTTIAMEEFNPASYDINQQDFQTARSDEMRFGQDQFKPTTIEMVMHVLNNRLLDQYESTIPNFWKYMPTAEQLGTIWRNDDKNYGRKVSGSMIPLYYCGADGIGKAIFGRPGKFSKTPDPTYKEWVKCLGEFRRADTLAYSAKETMVPLLRNSGPTYIQRKQGNVDSWCRFLLEGPLTNPSLTVGEASLKLNATIADGELVEISSYPWQRRVVNNNRVNLSANLTGDMIYLDRMSMPFDELTAIRWTADNVNTFQPALGNQSWEQDIDNGNVFDRTLPSTFTQMHGRVVTRFDLFNPVWPKKFIGSGMSQGTATCLYNKTKFNTNNQFCEVSITEPWGGRSGIGIMSNEAMSNYALLEVQSGPSVDRLRIRQGSSPSTWGGVLANYNLGRSWLETDRVGFGYDPGTNRFIAYLNASPVLYWEDTGNLINKTATNRSAAFTFDMDGNLFTIGTGFANIVCYDRATVPSPVGSVHLFYRDAWSSL